jgi:hypothetical protein
MNEIQGYSQNPLYSKQCCKFYQRSLNTKKGQRFNSLTGGQNNSVKFNKYERFYFSCFLKSPQQHVPVDFAQDLFVEEQHQFPFMAASQQSCCDKFPQSSLMPAGCSTSTNLHCAWRDNVEFHCHHTH